MLVNNCNGEDDLRYWEENKNIVGIDECGRGSVAGNIFIGLVSFKINSNISTLGLRDSKKLSNKKRFQLDSIIKDLCIYIIVEVTVEEINTGENLNTLIFKRIRDGLLDIFKIGDFNYDDTVIFFDGKLKIPRVNHIEQIVKPKFDDLSWHVAAASILAKNAQVTAMKNLALEYPNYGFENHNGYGSKFHYKAINENGILDVHRKNWINL